MATKKKTAPVKEQLPEPLPEPAPEEPKPLTKPAPVQRGLRVPRVPGS